MLAHAKYFTILIPIFVKICNKVILGLTPFFCSYVEFTTKTYKHAMELGFAVSV